MSRIMDINSKPCTFLAMIKTQVIKVIHIKYYVMNSLLNRKKKGVFISLLSRYFDPLWRVRKQGSSGDCKVVEGRKIWKQ